MLGGLKTEVVEVFLQHWPKGWKRD